MRALLTPGDPSHAVSEVLTRRGWLVVDSNTRWLALDRSSAPVSIAAVRASAAGRAPIAWRQPPPFAIYRHPFVFVYGLYSRHGEFYPPYDFVPDVNYAELMHNVSPERRRPIAGVYSIQTRLPLILKCLACGAVAVQKRERGWSCDACAAEYPIVGGVARFVSSEHYVGSFGFQWNTFAKSQLDSANGTTRSRDAFEEKTGWTVASLRGQRVLDAGCGMGRFAEVCADAGADVHAIDLSRAVEAAARNLGGRPNVAFYQADIMNLPFPDGTFDAIYSIGVLHHTPDTRRAFLSLTRLLKPGGRIAIWVYSTKLRLMFGGELLRLVTPRLPQRAPPEAVPHRRAAVPRSPRSGAGPVQHRGAADEHESRTRMAMARHVRLVRAAVSVETLVSPKWKTGSARPDSTERRRADFRSRSAASRVAATVSE